MSRPTQALAIASLILNLFVFPGFGSTIAGRKDPGIKQMVLAGVSIPLMFIFIGLITFMAAWVWALSTSIEIVRSAR